MSFTKKELVAFEILMRINRDSPILQRLTDYDYIKSIKLLNKIRKQIGGIKWKYIQKKAIK